MNTAMTELIDLLTAIKPKFGAVGSRDDEVQVQRARIDDAINRIQSLVNTPESSAVQGAMGRLERDDHAIANNPTHRLSVTEFGRSAGGGGSGARMSHNANSSGNPFKPNSQPSTAAQPSDATAQPLKWPALPNGFIDLVKKLVFMARTTGGTAGRDDELCDVLDAIELRLEAVLDPEWQAGSGMREAYIKELEATVDRLHRGNIVYACALQDIGYALELDAGSDMTKDCVPAIELLKAAQPRVDLTDERAAFIKWAEGRTFNFKRSPDGGYYWDDLDAAWQLWQSLANTAQGKPDHPECSGDASSCPENEGHGCCKPNPTGQPDSWQPIETAPAGEEILVVATLYHMLCPEPQRLVATKDYGNGWWSNGIPLSHVTKWMRLPEDEVQS